MYIFPEEIKKSYESLKIPLIIMGPAANGKYAPLVISDGLLVLNNLTREESAKMIGQLYSVL